MSQIQSKKDEADDARKHTRLTPAQTPRFAPAGQSTQLVIGATPTSDREIIHRADHLYSTYKLRRVYYTGFSPYPLADARLPLKPTPLIREHRLYQADWLMRFYGFLATELTSEDAPELSLTEDPKTSWANRHPEFFPVDINTAPREAILRVPGIGYKNVDRILRIRRYQKLALDHLRKLHIQLAKASAFITTTDHLPRPQSAGHSRRSPLCHRPPPSAPQLPSSTPHHTPHPAHTTRPLRRHQRPHRPGLNCSLNTPHLDSLNHSVISTEGEAAAERPCIHPARAKGRSLSASCFLLSFPEANLRFARGAPNVNAANTLGTHFDQSIPRV